MVLEQDRLIKEYWELNKHLYPSLSFEEFYIICKYPSIFIKEKMKSKEMPIIHIKYLGKFKIFPGRLKRMIKDEEAYLERGIMTQEQFEISQAFKKDYLTKLLQDEEDSSTDEE